MNVPVVSARGVGKSFGRTEVLKGVDLCVEQGQVVCLFGPSGSGKSTFPRCYRRRGDVPHELPEAEVCCPRTRAFLERVR